MINFFKLPNAILCLAIGCTLGLVPQSQGAIVSFTASGGAFGDILQDVTNHKLGVYIFNIFDGNPGSIGVDLFGQWDLSGEITGFHVDFTSAFSSPRTIASSLYTNTNNLSDPTDDSAWPSVVSGLLSTSTSPAPGDTTANGEWWEDQVRFNVTTQGSLGFTGYFVVADIDRGSVPEPGTRLMLVTGLLLLGMAVKVSRRKTQQRSL